MDETLNERAERLAARIEETKTTSETLRNTIATLCALAAENATLRTERDDLDHMCKLAIAQRIAAEEQRDAAIREAEARGMERAIIACEAQKKVFKSHEYATPQPLGSFQECFAVDQCIAAIRAAKDQPA